MHRDIKGFRFFASYIYSCVLLSGANVLIDLAGNIKLADFGASRRLKVLTFDLLVFLILIIVNLEH